MRERLSICAPLVVALWMSVGVSAAAAQAKVTFDEVDFGPGVTHVDPLPPRAFAEFGIILQGFYWGQDSRDPFGDGQKLVGGQFGKTPIVQFDPRVSSVSFDYWTVDATLGILVQAYNAFGARVGTYRGSGTWTVGGGHGNISAAPDGAHGDISTAQIDHITVLCRETATGTSYGCGSVGVSTLAYRVPTISRLSLNRSVVAGCLGATAIVTLPRPAPSEGVVVSLSDTLGSATVPATLRIPGGTTQKKFIVTTTPVSVMETGMVSATLGATTVSLPLTVRPMGLQSLILKPRPVIGSNPLLGTLKLECAAGPGPITVALRSTRPSVANPVATSIVIPQGLKSVPFDVTTYPVVQSTSATIIGTANGTTARRDVGIKPAAVIDPRSLKFGGVQVGATSVGLGVTLSNKGSTPFTVDSIVLLGNYAFWFAQSNNCPTTLAPGRSCTIGVHFNPISAATKSARLSIATSATEPPVDVYLSGTGVLPQP